jgi:predicted metalloprotease
MRWRGRRGSDNVEDRRSMAGPAAAGGGLGIVGVIVIIIMLAMGVDPTALLQQQQGPGVLGNQAGQADLENDETAKMVSVVLADTEDVWGKLFEERGDVYREPKLILFRNSVKSACGFQSSATGPFYCPADNQVYIDLSFFKEMKTRLGAPGDFAQAYVIAHEVGHHVQNLLGTSDAIHRKRRRSSKEEANRLSVRQELQADFYAGVWAHHAQQNWNILEEGDIQEALNAARAIGDDRLQMEARGYVVPESFTHGTSEQRKRWFMRGLKSGDMRDGDTYTIPYEDL